MKRRAILRKGSIATLPLISGCSGLFGSGKIELRRIRIWNYTNSTKVIELMIKYDQEIILNKTIKIKKKSKKMVKLDKNIGDETLIIEAEYTQTEDPFVSAKLALTSEQLKKGSDPVVVINEGNGLDIVLDDTGLNAISKNNTSK